MLMLLSCGGPAGGAAGQESGAEHALNLSVQTDRPVYRVGESVQFTLTLSNSSARAATLHCKDAQRFDLTIVDRSGQQIWRWSEDQMFAQMLSEETIRPGKSRTYAAVFPGTPTPGEYRASGVVVCLEPALSASTHFAVK